MLYLVFCCEYFKYIWLWEDFVSTITITTHINIDCVYIVCKQWNLYSGLSSEPEFATAETAKIK